MKIKTAKHHWWANQSWSIKRQLASLVPALLQLRCNSCMKHSVKQENPKGFGYKSDVEIYLMCGCDVNMKYQGLKRNCFFE